jgi:hypothetical protein
MKNSFAITVIIAVTIIIALATHANAFNGQEFYEYTKPTATPFQKGAAYGYVRGFVEASKTYDSSVMSNNTGGYDPVIRSCFPKAETIRSTVAKIRDTMFTSGSVQFMEQNMATWMAAILPVLYPCGGGV